MPRDPKLIARVLRFVGRPLQMIFRVQVTGIENVPPGPVLLIANHNCGAAIEILSILNAWEIRFHGKRDIYGLAHPFPFKLPWMRPWFKKLGGVPASFSEAFRILDGGDALAIFPGGNYEGVRPFWQRHRCDFGGHRGWAKIAVSRGVPVVPISIVGSHSVNPILIRSQTLSWLLVLPKLLRVRWFAISVSQIIYTLLVFFLLKPIAPVWLTAGTCYFVFCFSVLWPIWPAQIQIKIGSPVFLSDPDEGYQIITDKIQQGMDSLRV